MLEFIFQIILVLTIFNQDVTSVNIPRPQVYVVTPSPGPPVGNEGRSAPFYYHNWMRRMDAPFNITTTTTTSKPKTPDLIFAEFESGNKMKSIRKLLENERVQTKTTTTTTTTSPKPIYVADSNTKEDEPVDMTDYFALYNNLYNKNSEDLAPVYVPSTSSPSTVITKAPTTSSVEDIWHIMDGQKYYPGKWKEETIPKKANEDTNSILQSHSDGPEVPLSSVLNGEELDESFAIPGFGTKPGSAAENESRAIRTEPNLRYPYVDLKPFQVKTQNKPLLNTISQNKKGNHMLTSVDNFQDVKNPIRGEAQDIVPTRQAIDRYNPAQPYLPDYAAKQKPPSPPSKPTKAVANLVPPPPPPPPKITDNNFPSPDTYDSFPPFSSDFSAEIPPPQPQKPVLTFQPPPLDSQVDSGSDDSSSDSDGPPIEYEYRYKPPPPEQSYSPPLPDKPEVEYSYDKPVSVEVEKKPVFQGYHYSKPAPPPPPPPPSYSQHDHSYADDMKDTGIVPPPPYVDLDPPIDDGYQAPSYGYDNHNHGYGYGYHYPSTTTTETPRVNRYSYYYLGKKLYYLPLYFSVYFIIYVGALIIKAVLRHKIVYPNSWRPNDTTAGFFSKRSIDSWNLSNEQIHEISGKVTHAIATAAKKYYTQKK